LCTLTLGSLRYKEEQYEEAERWLRISLEKDSEDPQTYSLLSEAIFIPLQASLRGDPPLPWQLPEPVASRAREAEGLLTRAIEILERQENRSRLRTALVNRAAIRLTLGMFPEVLQDCDCVLAEDQTDNMALRNKGVALLQLDRATEAADCLERITDPEERSTTILILAVAYWQAEAYEKVVTTLMPRWSLDAEARQQIDNGDMLASAYMKVGKEKEAGEVVRQLAERWPGDPDVLAALARQRRREGKLEEAGALLREAISYARDHQRQHIALQLADLHYEQGNYSEAAALYAPLVETHIDSPILQRYLIALFNAGSYREALTLAQSLRGDRPAVPTVTEIEAMILEHVGDLEAARSLRIKLSEVEPKKVWHRVQIALLEIRLGERERAKGTLSEIRFEDIKHDAKVLMQVAKARTVLGMGDILPLAYRARQIAFGDPDIHFAYVALFLRRDDADHSLLEPSEVGVDCTVHLKRNGETRRFTILNEASANRDRDELALADTLAVKLLGKHKGDEVVLKDHPFERLAYEVVDVQSKYVFAFQETISGFTTWFPDHPALHRVEFKKGDPSKIKTLLDARQKHVSEAKHLYLTHNLTLGAFARMVGSRPIEVWAGMMSSLDDIVIASTGAIEESRKEAELLASAQELVADLTGLLTFEYIGLLDRLVVGFRRIIVPQAVLDEINETLTERFFGPRPTMNLWKEGDQYLRRETTVEAQKEGQEFLERIRSFIESSAEIVPASAMLDFEKTKFEEVRELLGHDAIAAALVARERKLLLFSDDLGLRQLARNDWQVEGVWSQTILVALRDRGIIREEDYREAIRRLALGNYYFVSIKADDLMWVLGRNNMKPTYEVSRMLSLLEGPDCSEETAIRVVADLIRKLWLEPILYDQKLWGLDLALGALTKGRMVSGIIERLKAALRARFRLMPLALPVIFRSIDLWSQQRLVEGGMIA
jgi:tetratricopeptide (TPR) repeat protein